MDFKSNFCSFPEVSCTVPAEFEGSHAMFASVLCSGNQTRKYKIPNGNTALPKPDETMNKWSGFIRMESVNLQKLLFGEAILVGVVYCAVRWLIVAGHFGTQTNLSLHTSYIKVPIYIILQTIACIAWIAFAMSTTSEEEVANADANFLCDFEVMRLSNLHSYTVQCAERGEKILRFALRVNFGLCVVVTVTKFTHLMMIFIIQPLLVMKSMATNLAEKNVPIIQFIFSDLYFSMLVRGQGRVSLEEREKAKPETSPMLHT